MRETADRDQGFAGNRVLSPTAALVRRHDRDRFQTALFAPAGRREALYALYAFNYEIARVRERVREPMLGQVRLQWWREVVAEAYQRGPARRHEVAAPLTAAIRAHGLSRAHFERLIDSRARDLDEAAPATLVELEDYAEGTSSRLVLLALEILDARGDASGRAGHHVGIAYALAGLLRALRVEARARRRLIPDDIARRTNLDERDYLELRVTLPLKAAVAEIAAAARRHLDLARAERAAVPHAALPALLPAVIARRSLARLQAAGSNPFAPGLAGRDPRQSWRLAFATLRGRF